MTEPLMVRKMVYNVPYSLEILIDSGMATPEQVAEYDALMVLERARSRAVWRAKPLGLRVTLTLRWWMRWHVVRRAMGVRYALAQRLYPAAFEEDDE